MGMVVLKEAAPESTVSLVILLIANVIGPIITAAVIESDWNFCRRRSNGTIAQACQNDDHGEVAATDIEQGPDIAEEGEVPVTDIGQEPETAEEDEVAASDIVEGSDTAVSVQV